MAAGDAKEGIENWEEADEGNFEYYWLRRNRRILGPANIVEQLFNPTITVRFDADHLIRRNDEDNCLSVHRLNYKLPNEPTIALIYGMPTQDNLLFIQKNASHEQRQQLVVAQVDWHDPDSDDHDIAQQSRSIMRQQLQCCVDLGLGAYVVHLRKRHSPHLLAIILEHIRGNSLPIWVRVPILKTIADNEDPWWWWKDVRDATQNSIRVQLCLEINNDDTVWQQSSINSYNAGGYPMRPDIVRWMGEPMRCLWIPKSMLVKSNEFMTKMFGGIDPPPIAARYNAQNECLRFMLGYGGGMLDLAVVGNWDLEALNVKTLLEAEALTRHYVYFIYNVRYECRYYELELRERYSRDSCGRPTEPLALLLSSNVYDEWEKDKVKYEMYRESIYHALDKLVRNQLVFFPTVFVLGAGQGGLVQEIIEASKRLLAELKTLNWTGKKLLPFLSFRPKIYIVEKNPYVLTKLLERCSYWKKTADIHIIIGDMRKWRPADGLTADLIVTEMLGGFACNELSPECLEGARHLMNVNTICLPSKYTNYLTPVMSTATMRGFQEENIEQCRYKPYEGWVQSRCYNRFEPSYEDYQPVFTYSHPTIDDDVDARLYRERVIEWNQEVTTDCEVHGFFGVFSAWLPSHPVDLRISTVPLYHTRNLTAWSPIFFPLREAVLVHAGQKLKAWMARKRSMDGTRVYYEWRLLEPVCTPIQNENGAHKSLSTIIEMKPGTMQILRKILSKAFVASAQFSVKALDDDD